MKQTAAADLALAQAAHLALDETAELTIFNPDGTTAHVVTVTPATNVRQAAIALPGDHPAALWLVDYRGPDAIHATLVRDQVRVNVVLENWQVRAVGPCPACNHSGSVLDTWWKWIDTVIGAPVATIHGAAHQPQP